MVLELIYPVVALVCTIIFLPLPLYRLILHRNISHFRRHKSHAFFLLLAFIALSAAFAFYNISEISASIGTGIIMKAVGILLFAAAAGMGYLAGRGLGKKTLLGIDELENKTELADSGIYSAVRHPRYLTIFLFLFGLFLVTGMPSIAYLFVYSIAMFHLVAKEEERELNARLGQNYADYKKRTGRFVPRIRRKHKQKVKVIPKKNIARKKPRRKR